MLMTYLLTRVLDIIYEELRPWNSHFCKYLFITEKRFLLTKHHENRNLRIQNNKNLATWYFLGHISVHYKSFSTATSVTEKWQSVMHFPQ